MILQIKKWGNSLALRIPKSFAKEINLDTGTKINLTIENGKLIIEPLKQNKYKLNDLLSEVNENNIHSEYSTGKPRGKEIW
ncbi:AbrB/MazE/SpoVT family DNA-binding domain-containing protein [Candidatus Contubernalis alkaliaceticus]|uniref:AbrB/MazE/SpoVT family DNA-binding domain-containing protein n=1 Tax=Candidatus Contubernalis alkaliaceticus TaxID=338645 RepID=UPI001F4BF533|nr:AbrB/MazE/SpoVT family DNA-binding domain-containing protein [Candidatus Contubernalis alkalaceticus]UNC91341.1 AbrB/MazE/SpoVT family DNA-binding domain-containing protein [Candidatus Contubernalis alkalaceticus]